MLERLIFFVGSPYCGSTILGRHANEFDDIAYAGELDRLSVFDFWLHREHRHFEDKCAICTTHEKYDCQIFKDNNITGAKNIDKYLNIVERFGRTTVIDGSKNIDWLNWLLTQDLRVHARIYGIVCVRNVLAYYVSQRDASEAMLHEIVEGWKNIYRHTFRTLTKLSLPFVILRFEDVIANGMAHFERILLDFGITLFRGSARHELHCIGGNTSAYVGMEEFFVQRLIERENRESEREVIRTKEFQYSQGGLGKAEHWKSKVTEDEARQILSIPGIVDLSADLGYDIIAMYKELFVTKANRIL